MNVSLIRITVYSLIVLILTAVSIELAAVFMGAGFENGRELGSSALSVPAFWAFLVLFFLTVLLRTLARYQLLSRAELLCVLFVALMGSPIITVGFWRYLLPSVATFPRGESFEHLDAMNTNLWPHGPNLTEDILTHPGEPTVKREGRVRWEILSLADGKAEQAPIIEQYARSEASHLRVSLPVWPAEEGGVILGQPYLITALAKAESLGEGSYYYCRVYHDAEMHFLQEAFSSAEEAEITFSRPDGFRRVGAYGVVFPTTVENSIILEIGLHGTGRVAFRDLQLLNVAAIESSFRGRTVISESDFAKLSEKEQTGLLVKPDN